MYLLKSLASFVDLRLKNYAKLVVKHQKNIENLLNHVFSEAKVVLIKLF